jgi:hypothetical protein
VFGHVCGRAVESGGSTRNSREDLYGSRNYRGSNSSLNDGRFPPFFLFFSLSQQLVRILSLCPFLICFESPTNFSTFFMFEFEFLVSCLVVFGLFIYLFLFFICFFQCDS